MSQHLVSRLTAEGELRRTSTRHSVEANAVLSEETNIKKILFADADVSITAVECVGEEISVEGIVCFRTVYVDSADVPCSVELSGKFGKKFNANGITGSNFTVTAQATELTCRVTGAQELSSACVVELVARQRTDSSADVISLADPCVQAQYHKVQTCTETGSAGAETTLRISSILPGNIPTPSRVLFTRSFARVTSCASAEGKLLVEGEVSVLTLLATADEYDPCVQYSEVLPFHAVLNADGVTPDDKAFARVCRSNASVRLDTDEMGALRVLDYELTLFIEGRALRCEELNVLGDCYCPGRRIEARAVPLRYPSREEERTFALNLTLNPVTEENDGEIGKLCASAVKPCLMECVREDGALILRGIAETDQTFITLGSGTLGSFSTEEAFELTLKDEWDGADEVTAELFVSGISFKATSPSSAVLSVSLYVTVHARYFQSINAVSSITDCGERETANDGALIRICMGHAGETPWQVAKRLDVPYTSLSAFCPDLPDVFEKNTKIVIFN